MIAPSTRGLAGAALTIAPLVAVAGFVPELALACAMAAVLAVALAAFDAARGIAAARTIAVRLPPAFRSTKDGAHQLPVELETAAPGAVRLALRLPQTVESAIEVQAFRSPGRLDWPLTPHQRGDHRIEAADVERASPWGLWSVTRVIPVECEIRVYPNLRGTATRALFLRESVGVHRQRQVGRGREFEKLRDYTHGDSYDEVSWKATARRARPIVKVYQVERTQEVYVAVDASRLSAREQVLEKYVTAALHLGLAAQRQGDLFGLVTFADRVDQFIRARNGKAHYRACREAIYRLQPRRVSPDFAELFSFLQTTLRRRALLVVLTALDDPVLAEGFAQAVKTVSRRHLVLVNVARMPGIQPLFEGPPPEDLEDLYEGVAGHLFWKKLHSMRMTLERHGVHFSVLEPEKLEEQLAALYMDVKRRQAL